MRAKVRHRIFKSTFATWDTMCQEVEEFANTIPREDLINISHSDHGHGVIIVWYWSTAPVSNS